MLIYAAVIFFLVTLVTVVLMQWLLPNASQRRLQRLSAPEVSGNWIKTVVEVASPLASLSIPRGRWEDSPLRLKFLVAGIRGADAPVLFYAAKTVIPIVLAVVGYAALSASGAALDLTTTLFVLLLLAAIGCYLPNFFLRRETAARKREIFEHFPDAADLILICVEAGLGLDAALVRVSNEMQSKSVALAEELHLTNLETRAGSTREQALRNLAARTGLDEVRSFAAMLTQSDKFGTSVGDALRVFSDDLRHKRQMRAEEIAAKLSTKMLFPLVICIFPAISMVILGPAIVQVVRMLGPMLSGTL